MNIERRLTRLEDRYQTLYQRTYAMGVRRKSIASRWLSQQQHRMKRWDNKLGSLNPTALKRLGWLLHRLKSDKGMHVVILDDRESQLLRNILRRKYKTRS